MRNFITNVVIFISILSFNWWLLGLGIKLIPTIILMLLGTVGCLVVTHFFINFIVDLFKKD